jgi:hypothetical protein
MTATPHVPSSSGESLPVRIGRLFWLTAVVATVFLSAGWWILEPGGFGIDHPRFWANTVAPIAGLGVSLAALWALRAGSSTALQWLLPLWPAAALGAAVAGRLLFPVTLNRLWLVPLSSSVVMALAVLPRWRGAGSRAWAGGLGLGLCGALIAAGLVWTQYPPVPHTRPSPENFVGTTAVPSAKSPPDTGTIRLGRSTVVHAPEGSLNVRMRQLSISVTPMLTFLNGSKDGCWSVFARPDDRVGPEPRLRLSQVDGDRSCALVYDFQGHGPAELHAQVDARAESVAVEAHTTLMQTVYSHLNSYCDVEVRGHRRLELEFSPCMGRPIAVSKFDYPIARPARFAFVDENRVFRVVEATSGEKGPFRILASGHLGLEESLTIGLRDQGRLVGRISLADWSAEADTTISPTAGWGVPVNAIEFSLVEDQPSSPASIFITLAATSVGRGWDCVGHNPGTYRNRILLETVHDPPSEPAATTDRDR